MICERCGRSSKEPKVCSYCNAPMGGVDEEPASVRDSGEWGWAEISIAAVPPSARAKAIAAIQKAWEAIERVTALRLLNSQASVLSFEAPTARLLVRRDLLTSLVAKVEREVASMSVTFTGMDRPVETAEEANTIISLAKLNLGELRGLQHEVAREIAGRHLADKLKARAKILSIAKHVGVPIGELIGDAGKKQQTGKTPTVQAQYRSRAHSKEH